MSQRWEDPKCWWSDGRGRCWQRSGQRSLTLHHEYQVVKLGTSGNCWLRDVSPREKESLRFSGENVCALGQFKYVLSWPNDDFAEAAASVCRGGGGVDQNENGHLTGLAMARAQFDLLWHRPTLATQQNEDLGVGLLEPWSRLHRFRQCHGSQGHARTNGPVPA